MASKKVTTSKTNGVALRDMTDETSTVAIMDMPEPIVHESVIIKPLREQIGVFHLQGSAPFMQLRFSQKSIDKMAATHQAGSQAKSKKTREARNFDDDYVQAMHLTETGRHGIPAAAFRNALISACRTVGFKMTLAKLSIFIVADDIDVVDGTPLVYLEGTPEQTIMPVRNATGVTDLRVRPMWRKWSMELRIRFDLDQFSMSDVYNLLVRAGRQVGVGEGRPDSRQSAGLGYGLFEVDEGGIEYGSD